MKRAMIGFGTGVFFLVGITTAGANTDQIKIYKNAFQGSAPKCINCHMDKLPKKDDGKHDLGAYGLKVKEAQGTDEKISEETYKKAGSAEDFQTQQTQP